MRSVTFTRREFIAALGSTALAAGASAVPIQKKEVSRVEVKPTAEQLVWQDAEVGLFIHFNMFTFNPDSLTRPEGLPEPSIFNPTHLNTDQWLEAAKAIGAKYAVLTAKHGEGFCLWPTDAYPYSVKQSPWRGGKGDVVHDFVNSCRKAGIKPGIYCSVDYNAYLGVRGRGVVASGKPEDQARYKAACEQILTELWTRYGQLFEIWFDGGSLPVSEGGPDIAGILHKYQPHAVVFQSSCASIRWVGNEDGVAPYPCWATSKSVEPVGGGDPDGAFWRPGECDVPLRGSEWGWKPNQENLIRPLDNLMKLYTHSVGRNCNLLLNSTPNREGLIPEADMQRYREFGAEIQRRFGVPTAETKGEGNSVNLRLPERTAIDRLVVMEDIRHGERIRSYVVEGMQAGNEWQPICDGISVGHKRIQEFDPTEVDTVRLRITSSTGKPLVRKLAVYCV